MTAATPADFGRTSTHRTSKSVRTTISAGCASSNRPNVPCLNSCRASAWPATVTWQEGTGGCACAAVSGRTAASKSAILDVFIGLGECGEKLEGGVAEPRLARQDGGIRRSRPLFECLVAASLFLGVLRCFEQTHGAHEPG